MSFPNLASNAFTFCLSASGRGIKQYKMPRSWEMVESALSEKPGSLSEYMEPPPPATALDSEKSKK